MKNTMNFFQYTLMCILFMLGTTTNAQPNVYHTVHFPQTNKIALSNLLIENTNHRTTTVECWVKQDNPDGRQTILNCVGMPGTYTTYDTLININIEANVLYASFGKNPLVGNSVSCPFIYDTNWHHIAFIIDSFTVGTNDTDNLSLYVDGTFRANIKTKHYTSATETNLFVGTSSITDTSNTFSFKGHISRLIVTDSILYTTSFTPDCVFDTTTLNAKTLFVVSLTNDNELDYHYPNSTTNNIAPNVHYYADTLPNSPCLPIYTFSADNTTYNGDTIMFYAHNNNTSFNKGSYTPHIKNGFDTTISVTPTYGLFTDSIMIEHYGDTSVIYTGEIGDTTTHSSNKSHPVYVNTLNEPNSNIYPNPSYGSYTISNTHTNVTVYDMIGHIIKQFYVNGTYTDTLNTGIYIILINNKTYKLTIR